MFHLEDMTLLVIKEQLEKSNRQINLCRVENTDEETIGALAILSDIGSHWIFKDNKSSSTLKTLEYSKSEGMFSNLSTGTLT